MFKQCGFVNIDYLVENKLETNPSKILNIINRDWRKWVKPVCVKPNLKTLDPLDPTFGYTTIGASSTPASGNSMMGALYTSPADVGVADSITFAEDGWEATNAKGVIVLHSNLNIIPNGITAPVYIPSDYTTSWRTAIFSTPPSLSPNTDYVLMAIAEESYLDLSYDAGSANQGHLDTTNSYASPSNPTDATHNGDYKFSIYCTYTVLLPPVVKKPIGDGLTFVLA